MRARALVAASIFTSIGLLFSGTAWAGDDLDDLDLVLKFTDVDEDDHGKSGPSDGDEIEFKADLLDEDAKDEEGKAYGDCELDDVDSRWDYAVECKITFKIGDDKIKAKGTGDDDDLDDGRMKLEIYDGTGEFKKAEGAVTLEMRHHDKKSHPMFRDHRDHGWQNHKLDVSIEFED